MSKSSGVARFSALLFVSALGGCMANVDQTSSTLISDAVHSGGTAGFYFLPPMVEQPTLTESFDQNQLARLTVEIEERAGETAQTIATFTSTSGVASEVLRIDPTVPAYVVSWHTDSFALDPTRTYRIRILMNGAELGFADVDVVSRGNQLRNVDTGQYVPLLNGRTLPIQFRLDGDGIEIGAEGGEVELAEGWVALSFPPDAIDSYFAVTATPVDVAGAVPGTAFEFLPSPWTFAEPVTLSIAYPAGDPNFMQLVRLDASGAVPVESRVDLANHALVGEITSFSLWAIGSVCPWPTTFPKVTTAGPYPRSFILATTRGIEAVSYGDGTKGASGPGAPCECGPGFENCDLTASTGCEVDLWAGDLTNCGGCGTTCTSCDLVGADWICTP